jgi:hypothetical protein
MRRTCSFVVVGGILVAALMFSLSTAQDTRGRASTAGGVSFEYRIIAISELVDSGQPVNQTAKAAATIEARFNELGRDGWEIAESLPGTVVFKRTRR